MKWLNIFKNNISKIINIFMCFLIAIVFLFSLYRELFGVELSDEAYSIGDLYLVAKGGIPFVNNWSQMPGYAVLLAPFIKAFVFFSGGTSGIFLFYRFLADILITATMLILFYLSNKYFKDKLICIAYTLPFFAIKAAGRMLRGDELSVLLISISGFLFALSFFDDRRKRIYSILSGFITALSVMVYPALIVTFFFLVIAGGTYEFVKSRQIKTIGRFLIGAAVATMINIAGLSIEKGPLSVFEGIQYILNDVTYWRLKDDVSLNIKSYVSSVIHIFVFLTVCVCLVFGTLILADFLRSIFSSKEKLNIFFHRNADQKIIISFSEYEGKSVVLLSLIAGTVLCTLIYAYMYRGPEVAKLVAPLSTIFLIITPFFLPFIKSKRKLCVLLFSFMWVAEEICKFFTGLAAHGGIFNRNIYLLHVSYLAILFAGTAVKDTFFSNERKYEYQNTLCKAVVGLTPIALCGIMCICLIYSAYAHADRESSFGLLTSKVMSGPYKGLYTTPERNYGVVKLEDYVRQYTSADDYLLVMDNDPFIYMMSDATPCTPSTWDQALYSYHFDDPDLYYDYFDVVGQEPTKIIYMNYGRDEIMSIDVDYKFNDFVNENYSLIYENRDIFEWDFCGKRITCELLIFNKKGIK